MIIASVPHTGSRFVQRLLGCEFVHVYAGESLERIKRHDLIVVPLRHPMRVAESWKRRGKPIAEHPVHEPMLAMWRNLIEVIDPLKPVYVPIDNGQRELALKGLGRRIGRMLETDWEPVTDTDIPRPDVTLSDYERLAVVELMADPFFRRVGYESRTYPV